MAEHGTVLVVDDTRLNLEFMADCVTRAGYEVLRASSGEEALDMVAATTPDIILLDIILPGIDGYAVTERLKGDEKTRIIPIVLVTSLDALEDKVRGLEAGADDFLTKPVNQAELSARIRSLIRLKRQQEEILQSAITRAGLMAKHEQLQLLFNLVEKAKTEWENTMDCIEDVVMLTDSEERVRRCNKAFKELAGMSYDEILGKEWREVLSRSGLEAPCPCPSGSELNHKPSGRWFLFNTYPFRGGARKEVSGAVITLHNTTVVKRFTTELEKAYSELKLTQAKVIQQEKMASIGQLAAGVAHEINNPMGFISSNLNTMVKYVDRLTDFMQDLSAAVEEMPEGEVAQKLREKRKALKIDFVMSDVRELIRESMDGAERVRTIVKNLKSFSRVEDAESRLADVNECITSTINIVWNELKYKASLVRELGEIPLTRCHPQQLNQVFMNLLVNAAQAIDKQGEITIRSWHENGSILTSVSDTGCGMEQTVLDRIFEPFFTTKEAGKGTGLGLSITYDIVKKHNGEISAASVPGRGTTFTVRLPVVTEK